MLTVVDLFCGAGGLSYGFEQAGFKVVAAVDYDPVSAETYRIQNPNTPLLNQDIADVTGRSLQTIAGGPIDLVIGGPSCQGFSTHGKRNPEDPRNYLFKHFVRLVNEVRPAWVVMENVKGLLSFDRGRYRNAIHDSFQKIGYRIESRVLRAVDFGVPQLRERLFFIATRTNGDITFPSPTHCPPEFSELTGLQPFLTVEDAISDLPVIGDEGEATRYACPPKNEFQKYARYLAPRLLTLHKAKKISEAAFNIIKHVPPGKGIRALPFNLLPDRFKKMRIVSTGALRHDCTTLYHRLHWKKPSYTITCYFTNVSSGPFVHPSQNRSLTPREAARLQTFPDSYFFTERQTQRQIGNAVPPLLARAVASELVSKFQKKRAPHYGRSIAFASK